VPLYLSLVYKNPLPGLTKRQAIVAHLLMLFLSLCAQHRAFLLSQVYLSVSPPMSVYHIPSTNSCIESHYVTVPTDIARMPLQRSDAILDLSDPNIVLGPRKRRPTERLLENGDPLASKKVKCISSSMPTLTCLTLTHTMPSPGQTTNHTESSDDRTSDEGQAIVVEDSDGAESNGEMVEGETTEEDDDAELGM